MKTRRLSSLHLVLVAMVAAVLSWTGCATHKEHNTEQLLSAAGFRTMTPSTAQQQAAYDALEPYKVQRHDFNGKVVYAYADKKNGIVYIGNETNYQKYQQLAFQQHIAQQQVEAAEMNQQAAMNWGAWGPGWGWY